jgi:uncharacterized damage-inducible protein DinB
MDALSPTVARGFAAYYQRIQGRVHELVTPLSNEQLWQRPFPYGNSVGHLLLHLTGNLSYYIGAQVAGTGYVRTREREFTDADRKPKDVVLRDFDAAIALVVSTLRAQSEADWSAPYAAVGEQHAKDRFGIFLSCAAHAHHHVGQMIYLCKELSRPASPRG